MRWTRILLTLGILGVGLGLLQAAGPVATDAKAGISPQRDDARRVASKIDEFIAMTYQREKVKPAALTDDSAFLRRVTLDVAGRIPVVNDARKFLNESSPEKRADAVDRLLDSPGYVNHFTNLWLHLLLPEAQTDFNRRYLLPGMHRWLRNHFASNTSYDRIVSELVSLPMNQNNDQMQRFGFYYGGQQASPMTFYLAKQGKPEDIAASIGRLFLGVRLECAQCHDHPFGKWKREEFWSQAAFFAGLKGRSQGDFFFGPITEAVDRRELGIPNTDRVAQARFLDGKTPKWKFKIGARTTLAEWMTAKDNPFFARALVNRMWAHFFGVGLVDPVDDLVDDNPASHPELLEFLAREFAAHDFDLKFLIRAITMSRTYQLSSVADGDPAELRLFTRMPLKGLTGDQLFESLCVAGGIRDNTNFQQRIYSFGTDRQNFMDKFTEQEKKTEHHTSIPHALTMMNNKLITDATHPDRSEVLGAIVSSSFMSRQGKIEALFLAALSRKPTAQETDKFVRYAEKGGAAGSEKKAYADIFWALLNSTEFMFNH